MNCIRCSNYIMRSQLNVTVGKDDQILIEAYCDHCNFNSMTVTVGLEEYNKAMGDYNILQNLNWKRETKKRNTKKD